MNETVRVRFGGPYTSAIRNATVPFLPPKFPACSITIRDVPEATRDELAPRAARSGRWLQEFLRMTLEQVADKPDVQTVLGRVQRRKQAVGTTVSADEIVAAVGADRR